MTITIGSKEWLSLRSDIYLRDKGICWVCNDKVDLKEYDLGHLVDKCNGGMNTVDNLAVMHHYCNNNKPRHNTLEEAMKWKLTQANSEIRQKYSSEQIDMPYQLIPNKFTKSYPTKAIFIDHNFEALSPTDRLAITELVIEHFKNNPTLLENSTGYNRKRIIATRELSQSLGMAIPTIRMILREVRLVETRPPQITDGSQYRFVNDHLGELIVKYNSIKHKFIYHQPKLMGMSHYCMDIMFYLSGNHHKVSKRNFNGIKKRVEELNIPITNIPL